MAQEFFIPSVDRQRNVTLFTEPCNSIHTICIDVCLYGNKQGLSFEQINRFLWYSAIFVQRLENEHLKVFEAWATLESIHKVNVWNTENIKTITHVLMNQKDVFYVWRMQYYRLCLYVQEWCVGVWRSKHQLQIWIKCYGCTETRFLKISLSSANYVVRMARDSWHR